MKDKYEIYTIIHKIHRQFPIDGIHSWRKCEKCNCDSIGSTCADCLAIELSNIVGNNLAFRYKDTVEKEQLLIKQMIKELQV